jgi:hypothetical protein
MKKIEFITLQNISGSDNLDKFCAVAAVSSVASGAYGTLIYFGKAVARSWMGPIGVGMLAADVVCLGRVAKLY